MRYFFISIFLLIFVGLVVFYLKESNFNFYNRFEESSAKVEKKAIEKNNIIKALSLTRKNAIQLPAKELYLKINMGYRPGMVNLYQTIINNLNRYTLFGVEQILKLNDITYSIISSKNEFKLFVSFERRAQAKEIMELFKRYKFDVKLRKIK